MKQRRENIPGNERSRSSARAEAVNPPEVISKEKAPFDSGEIEKN